MHNSIQFIQPHKVLRNFIQNYYMIEFSESFGTGESMQKQISNGCVELIIGYQNTQNSFFTNTDNELNIESAIVGPHNLHSRANEMALKPGKNLMKFISINFKTTGFYEIFKIPSAELYNTFFETHQVLGAEFKKLQQDLNHVANSNDRIFCVDHFLIKQWQRNQNRPYNFRASFAVTNFIELNKGNIQLNQLIEKFNTSERTLERQFTSAFGFSIKEYCKIIRFKNMFDCIHMHATVNWADVVSQYGYYDQSHMISEFKKATGITPAYYVKYKMKSCFKMYNHLVILKPDGICPDLYEVVAEGEKSYVQNILSE